MPQNNMKFIDRNARSNWISLRNLVMVRWFAIAGQLLALLIAQQTFDLQLPWEFCLFAVGTSAVANFIAMFAFPENKRLTETEILLMLMFDIFQLGLLLALTGGLNNPFALLLLAPITIAATVLPKQFTALLAAIAFCIVIAVWIYHVPLRTVENFILKMPDLFSLGFLIAIETGILFIAVYTSRVTSEMANMAEALLATQMALAREQKLTDLGGVVAATAHELGTPLATIKLVSAELMEELSENPDLHEDARLIREQADRCRDILRSMGRAGKDDTHLKSTTLQSLVEEAAEPHMDRGKTVHIEAIAQSDFEQTHPIVTRKPEIIHGIRNLAQNAVDFANTQVVIELDWDETHISIKIADDGPGFMPHILGRIGEPFMRRRPSQNRPGYDGMGMGLFIAKTLLERSGADIVFYNGFDSGVYPRDHDAQFGAIAQVKWQKSDLLADTSQIKLNTNFTIP